MRLLQAGLAVLIGWVGLGLIAPLLRQAIPGVVALLIVAGVVSAAWPRRLHGGRCRDWRHR